ncbi:hypothetical protein M0R45_019652 [Rubus argutus]|uniref:Bromo domain-containing protein n=1 Tax=Rubus argutus TaxID=59490 RepID=A0AAW1X8S0_RUBAR
MHPKRSDGPAPEALRSSGRVRNRPKTYSRSMYYYTTSTSMIHKRRRKAKTKNRPAASRIAKMMRDGTTRSHRSAQPTTPMDSTKLNTELRRSERRRTSSVKNHDYIQDSSDGDEDMMKPSACKSMKNQGDSSAYQDELSPSKHKKMVERPTPRREGLRPRRSKAISNEEMIFGYEDEPGTSEEKVDQEEETENGHDIEYNDADDGQNEGEDMGDEDGDDDGDEDGDDDGDEECEEEQDGRRRYDLRNRADVRRFSIEEGKRRPRSPRRVLHQGMGPKVGRDVRKGGSRVHKRHRITRTDDSDDSLLVDELDQGPAIPWGKAGSRSGPPWLFGGLDMHGTTTWGLNVAASGWGHQGDAFAALTSGIQTAGPSSKGGADIQPLQVDDSVSFEDIGGLSEYIDALKEMVFFPLLALASAASKAGQKVSFYMRKGADVLSKWVGEAERQLKLLFEEAQRNQPSIIFFDEIDGLAPVRSSKQEQIHNSIVSTLLALMDGLDSRGQVVLIGATNRIDAIDGALRRPGRFDREFNFPLPGCEARAEILDIHSRKWKHPPSKELKLELAASCVGYCGADLKALCTEAAIRAFREKYPQVYTSDDKFVIDVDSVRVEKYHFVEAMSTITPAAHRVSSELTKLSMLSCGSAIPLVYRPRLLLCGGEGSGLDHLGPAILHELEKFPVHSLGLPSLLSDPSAKTPEEALFNLWWETAHEQLRAVLLTLLEEFPSDLPILLLATSSVPPAEFDAMTSSIFSERSVYQVGTPSTEDRSLFFDCLIKAALSVLLEGTTKRTQESGSVPELPKAPKVESGPKVSELKAKVEAEQHALRRLRMCLRDVCNRVLYDKRFSAFHYPVLDEDAPNYRSIIQNPMDVATLLQRVDSGLYITCSAFLQDVDLIVSNAKAYNGDDYNGARIVSRGYELRDAVHGMLSQMDLHWLHIVTRLLLKPEVNLDHSYEAHKRPKKNVDAAPAASTAEDKSQHQGSVPCKSSQDPEINNTDPGVPETSSVDHNQLENSEIEVSGHADASGSLTSACRW